MHFSLIKASDLILVDEEGFVVDGEEPINTAAFTIHSAIHKARPEINAACHAHSVHGKAFAAFGRELEMLTQDSLRFYKDHSVYQNFNGVVLDAEEGDQIAKTLGNGKAIILQNHGLLTVGRTIDEAAFWVCLCLSFMLHMVSCSKIIPFSCMSSDLREYSWPSGLSTS
jgi:ribulose-5-phosphate 4-epimerase/fuculose-1-phosphate aldolase